MKGTSSTKRGYNLSQERRGLHPKKPGSCRLPCHLSRLPRWARSRATVFQIFCLIWFWWRVVIPPGQTPVPHTYFFSDTKNRCPAALAATPPSGLILSLPRRRRSPYCAWPRRAAWSPTHGLHWGSQHAGRKSVSLESSRIARSPPRSDNRPGVGTWFPVQGASPTAEPTDSMAWSWTSPCTCTQFRWEF